MLATYNLAGVVNQSAGLVEGFSFPLCAFIITQVFGFVKHFFYFFWWRRQELNLLSLAVPLPKRFRTRPLTFCIYYTIGFLFCQGVSLKNSRAIFQILVRSYGSYLSQSYNRLGLLRLSTAAPHRRSGSEVSPLDNYKFTTWRAECQALF